MPTFEVTVDITSAIAVYEVEARTGQSAVDEWKTGKFLSLEVVEKGEGVSAFETFADDDDDYDNHDERHDWD